MKTQVRNSFIKSLADVIDKYVYTCDLFNGGCCYSAYVLAKVLKEAGIKYKVKMFQYKDVLRTNEFNTAINGNGVAHVAIAVRQNREWKVFGSCDGIYNHFAFTGERFKVCTYNGITPEQLLEGYENNDWNCMYDTENNKSLVKEINKVASKYISIDKKAVKVVIKHNELDIFKQIINLIFG